MLAIGDTLVNLHVVSMKCLPTTNKYIHGFECTQPLVGADLAGFPAKVGFSQLEVSHDPE
jgi:hypothetical protein